MARIVDELPPRPDLGAYEAVAHLSPAVDDLREVAEDVVPGLQGRTVWMVNSTEQGGGVAEMLPTMIVLLRELGVDARWVVIESDDTRFFDVTKTVHNLLHGSGDPEVLGGDARELFEAVGRTNAADLGAAVDDGDMVIVHDPQPLPLASILAERARVRTVWRCHIGLDESNAATERAWEFLAPFLDAYDHGVFSAPEYVPGAFRGRSTVLYPALDPLSPKNRDLGLHQTVGIMANSALAVAPSPVLTPMYHQVAMRLQLHGEFGPANMAEDIGLLSRPIVTQVSRWDRLKGWAPLLEAFVCLKERARHEGHGNVTHDRRLELVRLVLAGPDPGSVADDPESQKVLGELCGRYLELPPHVQRDVAILALPMKDLRENALMVNAIQRASSLVVQNSIREGFGLTVTEAMWKAVPVLTNRKACGPRQQVRDGVDGRLVEDPEDPMELCAAMDAMLEASDDRQAWGRNGRRRVHREFLVFAQLEGWLRILRDLVA